MAAARSRSAGRASRRVGSAARVKGRISSRRIGVVVVRNGCVSRSAGPSARAPGRRSSSVGPSTLAIASTLASASCDASSVDGSSCSVARMFASWLASAAKTAFELSTNPASWASLLPSSSISSEKLWTTRLMIAVAQRELLVRLARVAGGRLEAPDGLRQRAAVAPQPLGAVAEQQLQVVARVGVERGEDLVEVHVRQRLRRRDPLALGQLPGLRGARRQLRRHVLEPGLRPQQDRGVAVDRRVLALDLHPDDGPAALEVDARDLADLDAGDVDGLPLTRGDGLGGATARPRPRRSPCRAPARRPAARTAGWRG